MLFNILRNLKNFEVFFYINNINSKTKQDTNF